MSSLTFESIRKTFSGNVALHSLDLAVQQGELISLLGPSGCGKTTALRIAAGFEFADSGAVLLAGNDISNVPAHKRNMGMVFQSYSLFPNLDVSGNIGYGLRTRKVDKATARTRVAEILELVQLTAHARKYPHQLSGGQQQRVALARALAIQPLVLLLDEPLSALDAKVRASLRDEIRRIQTDVGTTTLFVTHDQEEALAISDRIAVMSQGQIEQLGTPTEIYRNPSTAFVARFIGSMNELPATVLDGNTVRVLDVPVHVTRGTALGADTKAMLLVRPEDTHFVSNGEAGLTGHVISQTFQGVSTTVTVKLAAIDKLISVHEVGSVEGRLEPGDEVKVTLDGHHAVVESVA
jgi:putative spermidine/putrescine transport system ATP-binding protein